MTKEGRIYSGEKTVSSISGAGKTGQQVKGDGVKRDVEKQREEREKRVTGEKIEE